MRAHLAVIVLCVTGCSVKDPYHVDTDANTTGDDAAIDAAVDAAQIDGPMPDAAPPGMITIPAGSFLRGCNQAVESCTSHPNELPLQTITVSEFQIDRTEVTQLAYSVCVDAGDCVAPSDFDPINNGTDPVAGITWQQAVDFCTFVGKRLPSEAEWEKAARGTDGRVYPWGNVAPTCDLAHYLDCALGDTQPLPVGSKAGDSPYGLHDMAGNVAEWVADWYDANYYQTSPTTDPQGPGTGTYKVYRGGGWGYGTLYLRTSNRTFSPPTNALDQRGFRCAL